MADNDDNEEVGKKTNIILTFKELQGIHLELQKVGLAVTTVNDKLDAVANQHVDHEVRIRALELAGARHSGGSGMAQWAFPLLLTIGGVIISLLNYLKP